MRLNLHSTFQQTVCSKVTALRLVSATVAATMLISIATPIAAFAATETEPNTDNSPNVSTSEVAEALSGIPAIAAASDTVKATSDADSAAQTTVAGTIVDIPKDASEGVTFGSEDGTKLDVELPNADAASDGKQIAPGIVAYAAGNGSANAVQATEEGGVRMLTVIDNPNAPTTYDYKVTVPNGGKVIVNEDGSALVVGLDGTVISAVSQPWAKDANDTPIKTYFTTDGQTLTQHVIHNVAGVVYPVTADPFWLSLPVLYWVIQRCGGLGVLGAVGAYLSGSRSWWAMSGAAAVNCMGGFVGGTHRLKQLLVWYRKI